MKIEYFLIKSRPPLCSLPLYSKKLPEHFFPSERKQKTGFHHQQNEAVKKGDL